MCEGSSGVEYRNLAPIFGLGRQVRSSLFIYACIGRVYILYVYVCVYRYRYIGIYRKIKRERLYTFLAQ